MTKNSDGTYNIFINANINESDIGNVIVHALKHIINDDFSKLDIQEIEYHAHFDKGGIVI